MNAADLVFGVCLLAGGALLLLTLVLDDIFSGLLGAIHLGFDVAGVSPAPMLLGFLAMFGVGGLFGLHGIGAGVGVVDGFFHPLPDLRNFVFDGHDRPIFQRGAHRPNRLPTPSVSALMNRFFLHG